MLRTDYKINSSVPHSFCCWFSVIAADKLGQRRQTNEKHCTIRNLSCFRLTVTQPQNAPLSASCSRHITLYTRRAPITYLFQIEYVLYNPLIVHHVVASRYPRSIFLVGFILMGNVDQKCVPFSTYTHSQILYTNERASQRKKQRQHDSNKQYRGGAEWRYAEHRALKHVLRRSSPQFDRLCTCGV